MSGLNDMPSDPVAATAPKMSWAILGYRTLPLSECRGTCRLPLLSEA